MNLTPEQIESVQAGREVRVLVEPQPEAVDVNGFTLYRFQDKLCDINQLRGWLYWGSPFKPGVRIPVDGGTIVVRGVDVQRGETWDFVFRMEWEGANAD